MSEHTPGPWVWKDTKGAGLQIFGPISKLHAVKIPLGMPENIMFFSLTSPQNVMIGSERWVQFEPRGWSEMQTANARLIAAAPELLDLVKQALQSAPPGTGFQARCLDAISKATGQV